MNKDILVCGVGGQGTVLASKLIGLYGKGRDGTFGGDHRNGAERRKCHEPCEDR